MNSYAMQRANGDWFAIDNHGAFRVPIFQCSGDAMIARSRNSGMLLFRPVKLTAHLLKELAPMDGSEVDFCLVSDPSIGLNRGRLIQPAQLAVLVANHIELQTVSNRGNSVEIPSVNTLHQSYDLASETWEDDGGQIVKVGERDRKDRQGVYAKCA